MGRIDYLHDPDAPPANSVVPSVVAFVQNDAGEVLMIQRSDNGRWALPGGGHDVGESPLPALSAVPGTVYQQIR
ncbi:NUDIX domain-containing protein [Micrococcus luteus]